ncbi:MAG: N-acetyl-gamma-glutamyl-phosphate reductase [Betaproteobacteria bacterium]|nr:N-acetyl-gamma-glutamyl-phosphate reductase [Betaproteobacteria bacterium]
MAHKKIKIGVVGGTGYTGVELLRLLAQHPHGELRVITSRQEAGAPVAAMFPNLRGRVDLDFSAPSDAALMQCDVVFFATPNGVAMQQAKILVDAGVRVIDIAADFRIKDIATWEKWYGVKHACPELVAEAIYGLPEVNRESIKRARIVANPGCYPTSVQLGFLPLIANKLVDLEHLIADAKSGVSGAGRKAEVHTLFCEASDNFKAYGVTGHRHHPEIAQGLNLMAGREVRLTFVPHLAPMIRGIHATLYARLTGSADLQQIYEKYYANEPFVDVLSAGSHPDTRSVRGSNLCRIAVHQPHGGDIAVVLSVIDNLTKGAAGQAIQNMNLMCGLPETSGLEQIALMP